MRAFELILIGMLYFLAPVLSIPQTTLFHIFPRSTAATLSTGFRIHRIWNASESRSTSLMSRQPHTVKRKSRLLYRQLRNNQTGTIGSGHVVENGILKAFFIYVFFSDRCGDGYLKIYVKGQELTQSYDKHDYEFCGKEVPHEVASDGPRVVLIFSSGETQGSGFKANYAFETGLTGNEQFATYTRMQILN